MEHGGVLERFVVSLGDADEGNSHPLPKVESGRTNQVSYVFDDHEVQGIQVEMIQGPPDHVGFEVARSPGLDLVHRYSGSCDAKRIVLCLDIPFDNSNGKLFGK